MTQQATQGSASRPWPEGIRTCGRPRGSSSLSMIAANLTDERRADSLFQNDWLFSLLAWSISPELGLITALCYFSYTRRLHKDLDLSSFGSLIWSAGQWWRMHGLGDPPATWLEAVQALVVHAVEQGSSWRHPRDLSGLESRFYKLQK